MKKNEKQMLKLVSQLEQARADMVMINIGIKRPDGKVECDTVYRKEMFTQEEVNALANKYACEVVVSCAGTCKFFGDAEVQLNTFINKKGALKDGESKVCNDVQSATDSVS